ncbi:MAG: hypothetical protein ACRDJ0_13220 [Actinomycetota bacterium]
MNKLSASSADQGVWKNAEAGLTGEGDVDFIAARSEWEGIRILAQYWAGEVGLGPVIVCRHMPNAVFFLTVDKSVPDFLQLDVRDRITFRGSTVFEPSDIAHLMEMDPRGFRRLRAGAEGLVKLVISGTGPGGRPKPKTLRKENVIELLASDPTGMREAAASVFARVEDSVLDGADAAMRGQWNRRAMATVEARYALKGVTEPGTVVGRLRARRVKRDCEIMRTSLGRARKIPGDVDDWLEQVARSHRVSYDAGDHD